MIEQNLNASYVVDIWRRIRFVQFQVDAWQTTHSIRHLTLSSAVLKKGPVDGVMMISGKRAIQRMELKTLS